MSNIMRQYPILHSITLHFPHGTLHAVCTTRLWPYGEPITTRQDPCICSLRPIPFLSTSPASPAAPLPHLLDGFWCHLPSPVPQYLTHLVHGHHARRARDARARAQLHKAPLCRTRAVYKVPLLDVLYTYSLPSRS